MMSTRHTDAQHIPSFPTRRSSDLALRPRHRPDGRPRSAERICAPGPRRRRPGAHIRSAERGRRSEEHTAELQSHSDLLCCLLLEKKSRFSYLNLDTLLVSLVILLA